ncbi:hypothetical protein ABEU97_20325 [Priestia megaterium]
MLNFIPMPHSVLIEKASVLDDWGSPIADNVEPVKVSAKISYNSSNEEIEVASGEMIRYTAQILLEGVPDVDYNDFVTWTDDRKRQFRKNPVEIDYKHDLSGNPIAVRVTV